MKKLCRPESTESKNYVQEKIDKLRNQIYDIVTDWPDDIGSERLYYELMKVVTLYMLVELEEPLKGVELLKKASIDAFHAYKEWRNQ
jgi:hypothetical protein